MIHANNKENLTSEYRITLVNESRQEVTNGVTYLERDYRRGDGKPVRAFLVVVSPDVVANIAVSAAPQGKTKTVPEHFRECQEQGRNVIAAINSGYFHLAAKTLTSYGMQIINGKVIKEPNGGAERYGDNWFGRTIEGTYVIGNTSDYKTCYEGRLLFAAGGGDILMRNGKNVISEDTEIHPRSGVAITKAGGVIFGCIDGRSEESWGVSLTDHLNIYLDLGLPVTDMLNLDGGGSSQLVLKIGSEKPRIMNTPALDPDGLRPVADVLILESTN